MRNFVRDKCACASRDSKMALGTHFIYVLIEYSIMSMERRNRPAIIVAADRKNDLAPIVMKWVGIVLHFWYWFVLSVIVAGCLGYAYQQSRERIYSTQAVVLIEQKDGGGGTSMRSKAGNSQINTIMELNGVSVGDNLKNEMFILSSLRLMKLVVPKLNLDVDYTTKAGLHDIALYKESPFVAQFPKTTKYPVSMSATIGEDGRLTLTNFQLHNEKYKLPEEKTLQVQTVNFGEEVSTPVGRVRFEKTKQFDDFAAGKEIVITHYPVDMAAAIYRSKVSADEFDKECDLIVLTCNDINPDRAADLLTEVVETYKKDVIDNKNSEGQRTAEFIDSRLNIITNELASIEDEYAKFKAENKIADLVTSASTLTSEGVRATNATNELATQLAIAKYLEEFLRNTPGETDVIPVVSNFNNSALAQQIGEYNRTVINRNRQANNSNDDAPWVREQDRQLENMRKGILSSLASYVKSTDLELRSAQSSENKLVGMTSEMPLKERQAYDINRQQNLKEALYTYLLNKREEVALQLAIEEANVRVVEEPETASAPIAPRTKVIMLIALLMGLIVPFLVLYIRNLFDTTVTTRKDVEEALTIPIVGELPHVEKANDNTLVYARGADLSAPIAEAFRLLRYGLHFFNNSGQVLLVTSSTPSHGKSFVSRNLASAIAITGKRVLLVDADIRVRNLSRNSGLSSARGVTEYLINDCNSVDEIIVKDGLMEGVDLLPAGATPPNTTELLMSERFDKLFAELRAKYDCILVDTTPAFAVADASIASRIADQTLFVIRVGEQVRAGLPAIEQLYHSKKCGNLCVVINDSDRKTIYTGYGKQGFSYRYGYQKKRKWWQFWKK